MTDTLVRAVARDGSVWWVDPQAVPYYAGLTAAVPEWSDATFLASQVGYDAWYAAKTAKLYPSSLTTE